MLGTFWLAQHTLPGIFGRCDRTLTRINLGFFSSCRCRRFPRPAGPLCPPPLAVGVYWLNIRCSA
jgi:hypothetical protein